MSGDYKVRAKRQEWESKFFGCPFYFLTLPENQVQNSIREFLSSLENRMQYLTTLVNSDDVVAISALESSGFHLLVPMVTLDRPTSWKDKRFATIDIGYVQEKNIDELAEIARDAFVYGRFSAEKLLPPKISKEMHATWARNVCNKSLVDETLVAYDGSRPIGFIGVRFKREPAEINLIAVNPDYYGKGIGAELVRQGCDLMEEWGCKRVIVRTESPNISAIRMYEKCGFRQINSSIYYGRYIWKGI